MADVMDGLGGFGGFKDGYGASRLNALLYEDGNEYIGFRYYGGWGAWMAHVMYRP